MIGETGETGVTYGGMEERGWKGGRKVDSAT